MDETRAGDDDRVGVRDGGGKGGHELLGDGAGIELPRLGVAQHAVGLKVPVPRVRPAHLGRKRRLQSGRRGGGLQGGIKGGAARAAKLTGKDVWKIDLGLYVSQHGFGASPILYEDVLILSNEQDKTGSLHGLDAKTEMVTHADSVVAVLVAAAPQGVTVDLEGQDLKVKGKRGELSLVVHDDVSVAKDGDKLVFAPRGDSRRARIDEKALAQFGVFDYVAELLELLDRDMAPQVLVVGIVDVAGRAGAELFPQLEADIERHVNIVL